MKDKDNSQVKISLLINSAIYFYDSVFIIDETDRYRLIVNHRQNILYDAQFRTVRGARIAFEKLFKRRKKAKIKPEWTFFYPPEVEWLEKKLSSPGIPESK